MMRDVPLLDRLMHDLKGPLAPLQTAVYLLGRDDLPVERRGELLDTLDRQARRLARMIDEAGDWFRASQQTLAGRRDPCELATLIDNAIGAVAGCQVEPHIPATLAAAVIRGDEARLGQMLTTLLRHAGTRDPEHPPGLVVAPRGDDGVRIIVSDWGPALDPSALAHLLEQPCSEPLDGGLGLHLLIAGAIARAHQGGLVAVPREPGRGLSLVCELPLG